MPYGLITTHDEIHLFFRLLNFYTKIYPKLSFTRKDKTLSPKSIGNILYTYPGEEIESKAAEKMAEIKSALPQYDVPAILLKKKDKLILLDGHRRLRLAWKMKLHWKAIVLVPNKQEKFGVEGAIIGKIKDMY